MATYYIFPDPPEGLSPLVVPLSAKQASNWLVAFWVAWCMAMAELFRMCYTIFHPGRSVVFPRRIVTVTIPTTKYRRRR